MSNPISQKPCASGKEKWSASRFTLFLLALFLSVAFACSNSNNPTTPDGLDKTPVIPPAPNPPNIITSVAEIKAGKTGEVLLYGALTRNKGGDQDEYFFTDDFRWMLYCLRLSFRPR